MKKLLFFLLALPLLLFSEEERKIRHFALDNERVYEIPIFYNSGVTTIMFPAEIEGIYAANAALNQIPPGTRPAFLIAYKQGSYYFSVRALKEKAEGYVNIVYGSKTYILRLFEKNDAPYASVSFKGSSGRRRGAFDSAPETAASPWLLKMCLDRAKAYDVLKKSDASTVEDITIHEKTYLSDYNEVKCEIRRVYRFNRYDLLVFYVVLKNDSDEALYYNPRELAFAVGDKKCFSALTDSSGEMPPKSESILFCAVTGASDGTRKLSPENDWKVLLFASPKKQPGRL